MTALCMSMYVTARAYFVMALWLCSVLQSVCIVVAARDIHVFTYSPLLAQFWEYAQHVK